MLFMLPPNPQVLLFKQSLLKHSRSVYANHFAVQAFTPKHAPTIQPTHSNQHSSTLLFSYSLFNSFILRLTPLFSVQLSYSPFNSLTQLINYAIKSFILSSTLSFSVQLLYSLLNSFILRSTLLFCFQLFLFSVQHF